jgi:hypothetical protein
VRAQVDVKDDWTMSGYNTVRRFIRDVAVGDYVWTREPSGRYRVGRIAGAYRYDDSDEARRLDLHQVRPTTWAPDSLDELQVPGDVLRAFTGPGQSIVRVPHPPALRLTGPIFEQACGGTPEPLPVTVSELIEHHLDPYDVEDLIYVWLQFEHGYIALPRDRSRDNPAHEFPMIHRGTGRRGIVQVKTGSADVCLGELKAAAEDLAAGTDTTDAFAYATRGRYLGDSERITIITTAELKAFMIGHPELMTTRIRTWMRLGGVGNAG